MSRVSIDPRAWLCWAGAAMIVPLMGRNPFALASVLLAVLVVRETVPLSLRSGWGWIVKLALVFAAISVVFNVLTVRIGDRVIGTLPGWVPLLDGDFTWNSVVYGLLSGLAILALVLIGTTLSAVLDWSAVLRMLPQSLTGAGVAGSVAFAFFPQMIVTYREISDARAIRGMSLKGPRDYLHLAPLLLSGGIERAVTLSELLESRGFGGAPSSRGSAASRFAPAVGLACLCVAVYLFAVGTLLMAVVCALIGLALIGLGVRTGAGNTIKRTRYRDLHWGRGDWLVIAGALIASLTILLADDDAIRYEPYPTLTWPVASPMLAIGLLGLLAPAAVILWQERASR